MTVHICNSIAAFLTGFSSVSQRNRSCRTHSCEPPSAVKGNAATVWPTLIRLSLSLRWYFSAMRSNNQPVVKLESCIWAYCSSEMSGILIHAVLSVFRYQRAIKTVSTWHTQRRNPLTLHHESITNILPGWLCSGCRHEEERGDAGTGRFKIYYPIYINEGGLVCPQNNTQNSTIHFSGNIDISLQSDRKGESTPLNSFSNIITFKKGGVIAGLLF